MKKKKILLINGFIICILIILAVFSSKYLAEIGMPFTNNSTNEDNKLKDKESQKEELENIEKTQVGENKEETIKEVVKPGYDTIEKLLDEEAANKRFQGVALVAEGDEIMFAKAYGYADEERENTLTTRFAIASNTKQFTAAGIMQLVDAGKIDLDQTIDKYFPKYQYGSKITIKNLLQMRSGIPCYLNEIDLFMKDPETLKILKEYEGEKYFDKYVQDGRWTSELILKNLYLTELKFEPNEIYDYCNTNYYLLGLIIEQVSGISYEEYIDKNIFEPSGMITSSMKVEEDDAKGHGSKESGEIYANPYFTYAAGNIYANVYDIFRWNRFFHNGYIVSSKSYKEMTTPVDKYGYGLFIKDGLISHSGVIDGFNSNTEYNPATDTTIIILENLDATTEILDAKYDTSAIRQLLP